MTALSALHFVGENTLLPSVKCQGIIDMVVHTLIDVGDGLFPTWLEAIYSIIEETQYHGIVG